MQLPKKQREEYLIIDGEWEPVMSPIEKNLRRLFAAFIPAMCLLLIFSNINPMFILAFALIGVNAISWAFFFTTGKIKKRSVILMTLLIAPFTCIIFFKATAITIAIQFVIALAFTLAEKKGYFK